MAGPSWRGHCIPDPGIVIQTAHAELSTGREIWELGMGWKGSHHTGVTLCYGRRKPRLQYGNNSNSTVAYCDSLQQRSGLHSNASIIKCINTSPKHTYTIRIPTPICMYTHTGINTSAYNTYLHKHKYTQRITMQTHVHFVLRTHKHMHMHAPEHWHTHMHKTAQRCAGRV